MRTGAFNNVFLSLKTSPGPYQKKTLYIYKHGYLSTTYYGYINDQYFPVTTFYQENRGEREYNM